MPCVLPTSSCNAPTLFLKDSAGIIEKEDLIAKVKEVAAAGPEGEAPAGYTFDAATGYWHSAGVAGTWVAG